ncbi:MAG: hypothetical protein ABEI74_00145 [Candidatus Pacearchaeota archaeon]
MEGFKVLLPPYAGFLDSTGQTLDPHQRAFLMGLPAIADGSYKVNKADLNKRIAERITSKKDRPGLEYQVDRGRKQSDRDPIIEYSKIVKDSKFEPLKIFAHYSSISLICSTIGCVAGFVGGKLLYN